MEALKFDEKGYLEDYPDVLQAVKAGHFASGEDHFNRYGKSEGRIVRNWPRALPLPYPFPAGSAPNRRDKILAGIDVSKVQGLEIGPLASPLVTPIEGSIITVDHVDTETLKKKYSNDQTVKVDKIAKVDAVWGTQTLQECIGHGRKVDYVVASHVVEHVPDLITWFSEIRSILNTGGTLRLAVPDRRFTFDYLRNESRLHDIIDAYLQKARRPLPRMILEHFSLVSAVDCRAAWEGRLDTKNLQRFSSMRDAMHLAKDSLEHGHYHDAHCWIFTPVSFVRLCHDLAALDLVEFACSHCIPTARNEFEFYIGMTPSSDRTAILKSWLDAEEGLKNSVYS